MKNKETVLLVVAAVIIGILVGILVSKGGRGTGEVQIAAPQPAGVDYQQKIKTLEGLVARDSGNRNAWVELGNAYYDSNQPVKAIEAYDKALAINGNDANVLTDQGVMFRQVGWFDRALANFTKANVVEPGHLQSLYNLGIVYRYDLNDFAKAKTAWKRYLELSPVGQTADKLRSEIAFIDTHPAVPAGGTSTFPKSSAFPN